MNNPVIKLKRIDEIISPTVSGVPKVLKSDDANISLNVITIFPDVFYYALLKCAFKHVEPTNAIFADSTSFK